MQLYKEANRLLDTLEAENNTSPQASYLLAEAASYDNIIRLRLPDGDFDIPLLRQQVRKSEANARYYSLSDFIRPANDGKPDYAGLFAITAGNEIQRRIELLRRDGDDYTASCSNPSPTVLPRPPQNGCTGKYAENFGVTPPMNPTSTCSPSSPAGIGGYVRQ